MSPLTTRVLAAGVFTPAVVWALWAGGPGLSVSTFVLGLGLTWEIQGLALAGAGSGLRAVAAAAAAVALAAGIGWLPPPWATLWPPISAMAVLLAVLARPAPLPGCLNRAAAALFGVAYCASTLPLVVGLRALPGDGRGYAIIAVMATWGADTGAYFAGNAFGRRRLYPTISPGKTVEGLAGGILAAVVVAVVVRRILAMALSLPDAVALGLVCAAFGALGDLSESMLKRSVGQKDSSRLLPGHGGLLDRVDGVLFALPACYTYVTVVRRLAPP